ncbi:MAG: GNAT family N-acetyltransferase [Pseudomonadota bacterium]
MAEPTLVLRAVEPGDLDHFFAQQRDPVARRMAAFTSADSDDRAAFDAHWARITADGSIVNRTIVFGGVVVGHVASFEQGGEREVTYWIARAHWGRGIATQALRLLIAELRTRPLHARAAADNAGSIRVLTNCGFVAYGTDRGFAAARGAEIDEVLLKLDS